MTTTHSGVETEDRATLILNPAVMTPMERRAGRFMRAPDHDVDYDLNSGADAILSKWLDAGTLSNDDGGAKPSNKARETEAELDDEEESEIEETEVEEGDESTEDEGDDESSEGDDESEEDDDEADEPSEATDDHVVKVTIDGETRNVSVKDLKRLYGQEASLTRKSQEVAQRRKQAEDDGARFTIAAQTLLKRAEDKFAPYASLDWLDLQGQLDPEHFSILRKEAKAAYEEVSYLKQEVNKVFEETSKQRQDTLQAQAREAVEVLKKDIPDWSTEKYNAIRSYAVKSGIPEADINQVTDPTIIKLLHKAMQFDNASSKLKTKKKAVAPKRVLKSKGKASTVMGKPSADEGIARLKKTGSADDAVATLMGRWANKD